MENIINNNVKVIKALDEQVIDLLAKFSINPISTEEDNADFEYGSFLDKSEINYVWEERAEQLQINIIKKFDSETVIKQQKLSHKQSATERSNKIKELITDAYIKMVKEDETIANSEFGNDYLPQLQQLIDLIFPKTKVPYNANSWRHLM